MLLAIIYKTIGLSDDCIKKAAKPLHIDYKNEI